MVYNGSTNSLFGNIKESNYLFNQNSLIKKLGSDEKWTISDKSKVPIDAAYLLKTKDVVRNAKLTDPSYNPLVSLTRLNYESDLELANRAYRLSAFDNNTFMIDIEPKADDALLQEWMNFPAQYTEVSMNGGVHLLIQVPDSLITDKNRHIFESVVQIKDGSNNEMEFLFNDHYITFTKKIPVDKPNSTFEKGSIDYLKLKALIDWFVDKKEEQTSIQQLDFDGTYPDENQLIEQQLEELDDNCEPNVLYISVFENDFFESSLPSLEECDNDQSTYEERTVRLINYVLIRAIGDLELNKNKRKHVYQTNRIDEYKDFDVIGLAYLYAQQILEYRPKHDEYRQGKPWLLYLAVRTYNYLTQHTLANTQKQELKAAFEAYKENHMEE